MEAVEASEVTEAAEANEAGGVSRSGKSELWTSESSWFLNSTILGLISLYLDVVKKIFFDRILKTHVEF